MKFRCLFLLAAFAWIQLASPAAAAGSDGNPWLAHDLSRSEIEPPLRRGAAYLARNQLADGSFVYIKDPLGRCCRGKGDRYSLIRHLGAVYALARAFEVTKAPEFLAAAERGFAFAARFVDDQAQEPMLRGLNGSPNLGENGFLLIDAVLLDQLSGRQEHAELSASIARFLTANLKFDSPYATSEHWAESQAVIGLMRYQLAGHADRKGLAVVKRWLDTAEDESAPTHWSVQAIYWLHRVAPELAHDLALRALADGRKILSGVVTGADLAAPPRTVGAKNGKLYSCNATARAEGLLSLHLLARALKRDADAAFFFARAREHLAFALQFQYGTDGNLFEQVPGQTRLGKLFDLDGGVFNDPKSAFVRIDFVAHLVRAATLYLSSPAVPGDVGLTMADLL